MPRQKSPQTLKNCCLKRIALSFDTYWLKDFDSNFGATPRLLYVIGPFEYFTCELTQALIDHFIREKRLKRRHFQFLLQSSVTKLDLSGALPAANHDSVVKTITARCQNLRSVNLCGLNSVSQRVLTDLVTQTPGLVSINLKGTKCNDQVLTAIARYCRGLRNLDICNTSCSSTGVHHLCSSHFVDSEMGCPKLGKLQIFGTKVTIDEAAFVLQHQPNLQFLGYDDICSVIAKIHFGVFEDVSEPNKTNSIHDTSDVRKYNLTNITSHGIRIFPVPEKWIEVGILSCPRARDVRLYCGATDASISHLKYSDEVRVLGLGNNDETDAITFPYGVLPVIQATGFHLLDLTLADIDMIDILCIGMYCRNIQKLSLQITQGHRNFKTHEVKPAAKQDMFTELRELRILILAQNGIEEEITGDDLELMLSNARLLRSLHLDNISALTSPLLDRVAHHNQMSHLVTLRLHNCDNIDGSVVRELLTSDGCLETVELLHCHNVTYSDYQRYTQLVDKQRLGIHVSWK